MANTREKNPAVDGLQTVCALVGITLGVVPFIRWAVQGEHGFLFGWIFGYPSGAMGYLTPLGVIVILVGVIAALERLKK